MVPSVIDAMSLVGRVVGLVWVIVIWFVGAKTDVLVLVFSLRGGFGPCFWFKRSRWLGG